MSRKNHVPWVSEAGDGYESPMEAWLDCLTCNVTVWDWMQGYSDFGNPDGEFSRHTQGFFDRKKLLIHNGRKSR